MKIIKSFLTVSICLAVWAHEASAEPAAARKYVDGAVTGQQVQARLQSEGFSPLTKINAEAQDDGTVTLKGVAVSDAEATRAANIAKEVSGVTGVQSEILIKRIQ